MNNENSSLAVNFFIKTPFYFTLILRFYLLLSAYFPRLYILGFAAEKNGDPSLPVFRRAFIHMNP
jgi:hypothetical protein